MGAYSGKEGTFPDEERLTTSVLRHKKTLQCANIIQSIKKACKDQILHSACECQESHFLCPLEAYNVQSYHKAK